MSSGVIRGLTKKLSPSIFTPKYRAVSSVTIFQNLSNNQKNNNSYTILNKSTFTPKIPKQVVTQHKNMSSSQTNFSPDFLFRQVSVKKLFHNYLSRKQGLDSGY